MISPLRIKFPSIFNACLSSSQDNVAPPIMILCSLGNTISPDISCVPSKLLPNLILLF